MIETEKALTIKALKTRIEKDNKAFARMSKKNKRITIAQDCINRIRLEQLVPYEGAFCGDIFYKGGVGSIKDVINKPDGMFQCTVCAKGALFMSYVGRVNEFGFSGLKPSGHEHDSEEIAKLAEIFNEEQLALIESAFEGRWCVDTDSEGNVFPDSRNDDEAEEYYSSFYETDERLIAICTNIIENEGTFVINE